jgi:2,3-bisphosphoglycerate-independent phosphoglycerate mutase
VQAFYEEDPNVSDQYLDSFVVVEGGKAVGAIEDGDGVVCFNFRGDRAIELSQAFEAEEFDRFDRQRKPDAFYCGMMQYDGDAKTPANFLVASPAVSGSMGEYLCGTGLTSYAVSETQKYGHVTYFWNGNKSGYIDETLEEYVEIPSDKVMFDERPWMKAAEITDAAVAAIEGGAYQFIRLNYANGDMVGHTGVRAAIRVAVEALDLGLARLLAALEAAGGAVVILADHGNADLMFTEVKGNREPMVAHTLNPVPCIIKDYSDANRWVLMDAEMDTPVALSNVAATLINLLGYEKPEEYDLSLIALKE